MKIAMHENKKCNLSTNNSAAHCCTHSNLVFFLSKLNALPN